MNDRIKNCFEAFCRGTTMHGFIDLISTKNHLWRIFWAILLTGAIGLTGYQIIREVNQFMEQSTNTRIEAGDMSGMYPPMKICSAHWIYWVDWKRALSLNFTKESLLYGMSFLSKIYTLHDFDAHRAKNHFKNAMAMNNFTNMQLFFTNVAKESLQIETSMNSTKAFQQRKMFFSNYLELWFMCYYTSSDIITEELPHKHNLDIPFIHIWFYNQPTSIVSEFLSIEEFNFYMSDWYLKMAKQYIDKNSEQVKNFSGYTLPLLFFVDGYSDDFVIVSDRDNYYSFTVSINAYRWIPDSTIQCLVDQRYISSNLSFCNGCKINSSSDRMPECDHSEKFCQEQIYRILGMTNHSVSGLLPEDELNNSQIEIEFNRSSCVKKCVYPCEVWSPSFTYNVQSFTNEAVQKYFIKAFTVVRISYPSEVIVMIETERHTWLDFLASIGGLLGVWTGASLLSLVQVFYICCFNEMEAKTIISMKKKVHVTMSEKRSAVNLKDIQKKKIEEH